VYVVVAPGVTNVSEASGRMCTACVNAEARLPWWASAPRAAEAHGRESKAEDAGVGG
jgi:hypothetical protein